MREYGEEQVGALDGEDIDGFVGEESPLFKQVLEQSRKMLQEDTQDDRTRIINWIRDMQDKLGDSFKEDTQEVGYLDMLEVGFHCLEGQVQGLLQGRHAGSRVLNHA